MRKYISKIPESIISQRWLMSAIIAICGAILFIGYSQRQFESALTKTFQHEQILNVVLMQNLIKDHIEEASQNLHHAADMIKAAQANPEAIRKTLDMVAMSHADDFNSLSLAGPDGEMIVSTGLALEITNLFQYVEIETTIIPEVSEVFLSERIISEDGLPTTFLFFPFFMSPTHPDKFFVVGELNLKVFINRQLKSIHGEEILFVVADYLGDIYSIVNLEHEKIPEMERGKIFPLAQECLNCHKPNAFDDLREAVNTGGTIHSLYKTPNGKTLNRTVSTVDILNEKWLVSISQPYSIIQGQISRNFRNNIIVVIALFILVVFGIFIYHRRRSSFALELQYKTLINNIDIGIFRVSPTGRIQSINTEMLSLVGWEDGKTIKDLPIESIMQDGSTWQNMLESLSGKNSSVETDLWVTKKGGDNFLASVSVKAVKGASGEILYIDGVLKDITDEKKAEEERIKISRLESIGVLAGGIAHDFNNLLTAVVGNISLSRLAKETQKRNELLIKAEEASFRAQSLTQQLLTFSRGGSPVLVPQPIQQVIQESADFVLRGSNCIMEYHFAPDLKYVNIDADQIKQVVQNLAINAKQAMPGGGTITINVVNETVHDSTELTPGDYVKITVHDSGCGIPSEIKERIFDPYFTTKETGTGLGLAVSYSVIKKHGGIISLNSQQGEGTIFAFYLPAAESRKAILHDNEEEEIIHGTGNILIIDDDPNVGETLVSYLDELGYEPYFVTVGEEAIQLLKGKETPFDVVITDLTIPGSMGGVEIKDHIRQIHPKMKIVVMSGYANDPVMAKHSEYGFDGIIKKPFKIKTVAKILHEVTQ